MYITRRQILKGIIGGAAIAALPAESKPIGLSDKVGNTVRVRIPKAYNPPLKLSDFSAGSPFMSRPHLNPVVADEKGNFVTMYDINTDKMVKIVTGYDLLIGDQFYMEQIRELKINSIKLG